MNCHLSKTVKLILTVFILGFFSGIYIGSTTMTEKHRETTIMQRKMVSNCIEVIIGKRPKGKLCQN